MSRRKYYSSKRFNSSRAFQAGSAKHLKEFQTKLFIDSISREVTDSENGEVITTSQLKTELKKARGNK